MNILSRGEAADIRQLFIDTFVDTTCNYFQNYILQMKSFSDGLRYTGYLWDCMIRRERVSYYFMQSTLEMHSGNFYVFWDIHPRDRILIKNYWKYPIDAVLCLAPKELPDVLQTLPEDCYFFDDSLSWAFASTHEELKPGKRICYMTTNT